LFRSQPAPRALPSLATMSDTPVTVRRLDVISCRVFYSILQLYRIVISVPVTWYVVFPCPACGISQRRGRGRHLPSGVSFTLRKRSVEGLSHGVQ
jgi:hypothetical protein